MVDNHDCWHSNLDFGYLIAKSIWERKEDPVEVRDKDSDEDGESANFEEIRDDSEVDSHQGVKGEESEQDEDLDFPTVSVGD